MCPCKKYEHACVAVAGGSAQSGAAGGRHAGPKWKRDILGGLLLAFDVVPGN